MESRPYHYGWKVDLVSPCRRTAIGFDVYDEVLDIVVRPDRSYYWNDLDQMEDLLDAGVYSQDQAAALVNAGKEVIALVEAGLSPFDDEWREWTAPAGLQPPEAPEGWQFLPSSEPSG